MMTEEEWRANSELLPMMDYLSLTGNPSDRKWRLFACACCRRIWNLFANKRCRRTVETAEQFADGIATESDLQAAYDEANAAEVEHVIDPPDPPCSHLRFHAATFTAYRSSGQAAYSASGYSLEAIEETEATVNATERLIADPNFSRHLWQSHPPCLSQSLLAHLARRLARQCRLQGAYPPSGELDTTRLAILADALEGYGVGQCRNPWASSQFRPACKRLLGGGFTTGEGVKPAGYITPGWRVTRPAQRVGCRPGGAFSALLPSLTPLDGQGHLGLSARTGGARSACK